MIHIAVLMTKNKGKNVNGITDHMQLTGFHFDSVLQIYGLKAQCFHRSAARAGSRLREEATNVY